MTRSSPLVSVVMAVRDGQRWLALAIDSLLVQTLQNLEILVIDDGSTDATPSILADYAARDDRIRILKQDATGLVAALNYGMAEARAPLVARLDADDCAIAHRLERQRQYLDQNPEIGLLGSWAQEIDETGQNLGTLKPETDPGRIAELLTRANPMIHSSVMMRTELARKLGGYRRPFQGAEDYDLWLRIAEVSSIANLSEILVLYRRHGSNVTSRQRVRQSFSVRLAQRSMKLRRAGEFDAALLLAGPPDWNEQSASDSFFAEDAELYRLFGLPDASARGKPTTDDIDFEPLLRRRLAHVERKLAVSSLGWYLIHAPSRGKGRAINQVLQLSRRRPHFALAVGWEIARRLTSSCDKVA